jgi:hypothetical protein
MSVPGNADDDLEREFQAFKREVCQPSSAKRKKASAAFVQVPVWWAEAAAKATRTPSFLVCIELLHRAWKAKSMTFAPPNWRLAKSGVSREVKRRVLRDLEAAGLIVVDRRHGKTPRITLVLL